MRVTLIGVQVASALGMLALLVGSCKHSSEEKCLYYPNGALRKLISKEQGKWEGLVWEYYPNGQLKSKASWHDDRQHGPAFFYYPNGRLQESTQWRNGKVQGKSLQYYRNGKIKWQANFRTGIKVGNAILYDSTGKPQELQVYNERGQLTRVRDYNRMGTLSSEVIMPIIEVPDTIQQGENFAGCVHFDYSLAGKTIMLIGKLVKQTSSFERYQIRDTIIIVRPDQRGWFCFSYKPQPAESGDHIFAYKFLQSGVVDDSLSVNLLSGTHPFYVQIHPKTL